MTKGRCNSFASFSCAYHLLVSCFRYFDTRVYIFDFGIDLTLLCASFDDYVLFKGFSFCFPHFDACRNSYLLVNKIQFYLYMSATFV